jgi:hypothetical protein
VNTVDKTHNATKWLALSHKNDVMLGVASDGVLHFWQPPVVLTSHMNHSRMFHCHCLQQAPRKFHDNKKVFKEFILHNLNIIQHSDLMGGLLSPIHISIR